MPQGFNLSPYWRATEAYNNVYRLGSTSDSTQEKVFMTYETLTEIAKILLNRGSKLVKIQFRHLDDTPIETTSLLQLKITRKVANLPLHADTLVADYRSEGQFTYYFGERFVLEPTEIQIYTKEITGTAGYLLSIVPYVQLEG